jgi:uncharacterized protein YuzE
LLPELLHDPKADALYIRFADGRLDRTDDVGGARRVDYAADGRVLGVEVMYPSDGVDVVGLPRAEDVAALVRGHGFRVASAEAVAAARAASLAADPSWERTAPARAVARAINRYRHEQGVGVRELARLLGMAPANVVRLQAGEHNPSIATLQRLARVLGLRFVVEVAPADHRGGRDRPGRWAALEEVEGADGVRVVARVD